MMNALLCRRQHFGVGEKKCVLRYSAKCILLYYSVIVTNVLELEPSALKTPIKTSGPHVHVATSDFQAELLTKLLLTGTHL